MFTVMLVIWTYILLYSVLRFVVEIYRGDEIRGFIISGISVSQGISIIMAIIALIVIVRKLTMKQESSA